MSQAYKRVLMNLSQYTTLTCEFSKRTCEKSKMKTQAHLHPNWAFYKIV